MRSNASVLAAVMGSARAPGAVFAREGRDGGRSWGERLCSGFTHERTDRCESVEGETGADRVPARALSERCAHQVVRTRSPHSAVEHGRGAGESARCRDPRAARTGRHRGSGAPPGGGRPQAGRPRADPGTAAGSLVQDRARARRRRGPGPSAGRRSTPQAVRSGSPVGDPYAANRSLGASGTGPAAGNDHASTQVGHVRSLARTRLTGWARTAAGCAGRCTVTTTMRGICPWHCPSR